MEQLKRPDEVAKCCILLERAMGIEPMSEAWEALNKTLKAIDLRHLAFGKRALIGN
jgi:hypothetical protein